MKKILFSFSIISICLFVLFACGNFFTPNSDNTKEPVASITNEIPKFYVFDLVKNTTTINKEIIYNYLNKEAYLPEGKLSEEYIDIRPMVYGTLPKEESVNSVTITENDGATCIYLNQTKNDIWDVYLASKDTWNFEANTNYKISFDAKTSKAGEILLVELKDGRKTERGANICPNLTTEFQTFSFETGSYNKSWTGHLQIAIGLLDSEFYIKNLKIKKIEGKKLPIGLYLGNKNDKISVEKVENGMKFIFETEDPNINPNSSWSCINTGVAIKDNKLYEVTFNASSNTKDVILQAKACSIDNKYSHAWKKIPIGTKPIPIKMYVPGAVKNDEEYRFLDISFNTPRNNSITITDIKVSEVSQMPQDVDLFVQINNKYGEISNEIPYSIAKIPAEETFTFDMAFSTINSREINWNDFCRICEFSTSTSLPESLSISNKLNSNGEVVRTFTNNTNQDKFLKISLDSKWEIVLEETDFSVIDGTAQNPNESENDSEENTNDNNISDDNSENNPPETNTPENGSSENTKDPEGSDTENNNDRPEDIPNSPDENEPTQPDNPEDNDTNSDNTESPDDIVIDIENINILVENKDEIQWSVGEWIFNYEHKTITKEESSQTGTREGILSIEGIEPDSKVILTTLDKTTEIFENEDKYLAKKTEIQEKPLDEGIKVTFDDENLTIYTEYPETPTEKTYTEFSNEFISYFDFGKSFYTNTEQNSYLIWYSQENENISESEMHLFVKK